MQVNLIVMDVKIHKAPETLRKFPTLRKTTGRVQWMPRAQWSWKTEPGFRPRRQAVMLALLHGSGVLSMCQMQCVHA